MINIENCPISEGLRTCQRLLSSLERKTEGFIALIKQKGYQTSDCSTLQIELNSREIIGYFRKELSALRENSELSKIREFRLKLQKEIELLAQAIKDVEASK